MGTKGQEARVPRESYTCPLLSLWGIEETRVPYSQSRELWLSILEAIRQVNFQRECLFMTWGLLEKAFSSLNFYSFHSS